MPRRKLTHEERRILNRNTLKARAPRTVLPEPRLRFRRHHCGLLLEEFDPIIGEKTFCVVVHSFRHYQVRRFNTRKSLFLLEPLNPVRHFAITVYTSSYFDFFVISAILINCAFLAVQSAPHESEYAFLAIFTVEMLIRIVARGFALHPYSYLRSPWNCLDFCIVLGSYFVLLYEFLSSVHKTDVLGLRTFRVLRVIKTITIFPGLMTLVRGMLRACQMLLDVVVVTIFFLVLFAIIGLQLYVGSLRNKCVQGPIDWSDEFALMNKSNWLINSKDQYIICGNATGARSCPEGYTCFPDIGENPNRGYTSFDHFGLAVLTTFQLITKDFWEDVYNKVNAACGAATVVFFIPIIFFGSLYLMNLTLAVVTSSYEAEANISEKERQEGIKGIAEYRNLAEFPIDTKMLTIRRWTPDYKKRHIRGRRNALVPIPMAIAVRELQQEQQSGNMPHLVEMADINDIFIEIHEEEEGYTNEELESLVSLDIWGLIRDFCKKIAEHVFLEIFIIACIVINTVVMAVEYHEMPESMEIASNSINTAFTAIFAIEMVIKIVGLGRPFFRNRWNVTDLVIIICSVICEFAATELQAFTVLRMLRLVRVIRLAKKWKTMRLLVSILINTASELGNITLVLFIVIFIFAVTGMQTFAVSYLNNYEQEETPRWNFTTFLLSVMMVFRVLCGEFIEPLFDCFEATHDDIVACVSYFLPTLIVGNFLVFNLFLALLLNAFSVERISSRKPEKRENMMSRFREVVKYGFRHSFNTSPWMGEVSSPWTGEVSKLEKHRPEDDASDSEEEVHVELPAPKGWTERVKQAFLMESTGKLFQVIESTRQDLDRCCPKICYKCCRNWYFGESKILERTRLRIRALVDNHLFDIAVLALILASSIVLCFEDEKLPPRSILRLSLNILNYVFTIAFILEMILKLVAHGFAKYFADGWCWLDFCVVTTSFADLLMTTKHFGLNSIRAVRTLRALRPLRALSRWEGMKIVVDTLLQSIPSIGNVLVVCLFVWLIFSIMGVNFFAGKFYKCVDEDGKKLDVTMVSNRFDCKMRNLTWKNSHVNFDNALRGYLALFQVATFEGWMEIMEDAVDSRGVNLQPDREASMIYYLFFVVFIIIGAFIILNLFIGVIIDTFNQMKKEYEGRAIEAILTEGQKKYYRAMLQLSRRKPRKRYKPPKGKIRGFCYHLCITRWSEFIVLGIIVCHMAVMLFEHYGQANGVTIFFRFINGLFLLIYTTETVFKILAFGFHYFLDLWNVFDFLVWLVAIVGLLMNNILNYNLLGFNTILIRVFRFMRLGRALRLIRGAKGIRRLIFTLMISLPALFNISLLLLMVNFVYAVVGMNLFGQIKLNGAIDDQSNFRSFGTSMRLLFRLSTGGGWNEVLDALMVEPPDCEPEKNNCGSDVVASLYMVTFIFLTSLVIVNMYVAIILENYGVVNEDEDLGVSADDMDMFYEYWAKYDPKASQFIPASTLSDFVAALERPLQILKPNKITLAALTIPVSEGELVHCLDLQEGLIRNILGEIQMNKDLQQLRTDMENVFLTTFPTRKRLKIICTTHEWFIKDQAALVITRCLRSYCRWKEQKTSTTMTNENSMIANTCTLQTDL